MMMLLLIQSLNRICLLQEKACRRKSSAPGSPASKTRCRGCRLERISLTAATLFATIARGGESCKCRDIGNRYQAAGGRDDLLSADVGKYQNVHVNRQLSIVTRHTPRMTRHNIHNFLAGSKRNACRGVDQ